MTKWLLMILMGVFMFPLVNAVGICNPNLPGSPCEIPSIKNVSGSSVNDSYWLRGLSPQQVANLFVELDPYYFSNPRNYLNLTTLPTIINDIPIWLNTSATLYINSSYPQNINVSNITMSGVLTNNIPATNINGLNFNQIYSGTDNVSMNNFNLANTVTSSGTGLNLLLTNNSVTNNHIISGLTSTGTNQTTQATLNKVTVTGAHSVTSLGIQNENSIASDNQVYGGPRIITATTTTNLNGIGTKNYVDYSNIVGMVTLDIVNAYGEKTNVMTTGTGGTPVVNSFGNWIDVQGSTQGNSNNYGIYLNNISGADSNYGIYDVSGANWILKTNNQKIMFGASSSASIYYDGTNLILNPKEVGAGVVKDLGSLWTAGNITNTQSVSTTVGMFNDGATNPYTDIVNINPIGFKNYKSIGNVGGFSPINLMGFDNTNLNANGVTLIGSATITNIGINNPLTVQGVHQANNINEINYGTKNTLTRTATQMGSGLTFTNYVTYNSLIDSVNTVSSASITNNYGTFTNITTTSSNQVAGSVKNTYGEYINILGDTKGVSNAYGVYINAVTGNDNNWGIYEQSNASNWLNGNVTINNSLNQVNGNSTINNIYGELKWATSDADNFSQWLKPSVFTLANTFYNFSNATAGYSLASVTNGFSFSGGNALTAQVAGLYKFDGTCDYYTKTGAHTDMTLFVNGVATNMTTHRTAGKPNTIQLVSIQNVTSATAPFNNDLLLADGTGYTMLEGSGGLPVLDANFTFQLSGTPVILTNPLYLTFSGYYQGSDSHEIEVSVWNYTSNAWVQIRSATKDLPNSGLIPYTMTWKFPEGTQDTVKNMMNSSGAINVRIQHTSNGVSSHVLFIDQFVLSERRVYDRQTITGLVRINMGDTAWVMMKKDFVNAQIMIQRFDINLLRVGN